MMNSGGHFIKALGEAALLADSINRNKIKTSWKDEWEKYSAFALQKKQAG